MEVRDTMRPPPWLAACQGAPELFAQVLPRLRTLLEPCVTTCQGQAAEPHAQTSVGGLLSDVQRTNVESIASQLGPARRPLQGCSGWADGEEAPWRQEVRGPMGKPGGQAEGGRVFAPSGFPKSGGASGGGARQWGGRLGKGDHGPGGSSWGDVSRRGPTRVATRWSLPTEWPRDEAR